MFILIIITVVIQCVIPSNENLYTLIISPGHWANIIPIIFLSSLGSIQPIIFNHFWRYRAKETQLPPLPPQGTIYTPGWREAITVKCLAQEQKYHGRGWDSNPHSNNSTIRTQVRCTRPLGHDVHFVIPSRYSDCEVSQDWYPTPMYVEWCPFVIPSRFSDYEVSQDW